MTELEKKNGTGNPNCSILVKVKWLGQRGRSVFEWVKKKDDRLPRRFFREVLQETGKSLQPEELDLMLKEYYELRGWR